MSEVNKRAKALIGFKKAHSHLAKVIKMTEDGQYCIDVMQQNLAVVGLLKSAHQLLLENHLNSCFISAISSGSASKKQAMIEEIIKVSKIANK